MRIALTILLSTLFIRTMAVEPKYPVSAIPEDMKQGMYAVVRESESRFYIDSKSQSSHYVRKVITILNSKADDFADIAILYDKLRKVESFKANVYDAQGNLIKKLKQSDIKDQSAISGYSLFEDDRIKYADLSQTTYPYTVEYEYTLSMRYLYSIPDFYLYNDDEVTTQKEFFAIIYPKELKPRYRLFKIEAPKIVTEPDKRESMTWTFENTKPKKFERLSLGSDLAVPNIKVGPSLFEYDGYAGDMSSWVEYGKWIAQLNNGRDALPDVTKKKIRDITKDLKTTEEKTRALYAYLQGKTRYVSIQLGIGGLQPFDATTVDQTGYGDCKALSNYMVAMLKEAGVKGYYATIMAGDNAPDVTVDFPGHQG
ncbi:MAG TPA: DUF3857 domain-containing transglutaminase family protein, partial [Chryseolinea sp.]|nr:DUF3857 domain-containing transglutaminase family protein [Chryseolinea sp.]